MSTTIDSRVVEMKFDNRNFESNVRTTMSTLDRLKQSLNLSGATKGLSDISAAAGKTQYPLADLGGVVDKVQAKFSALQVMGVTALANITNSAINAGKNIASALTIAPIKTGFSEYETQINAVQTILANTESKGTTLQQVNSALDTLNTYADKTIYNFTEMTKNIGTFTAAGVDLDTSVTAIQGIANLAAVSGSTSQQASTAMYQLSQALSSGTVKLMDWNSVVNAGMGGQVFQDALKETARNHGIAIDSMIKKEGSFRETLKNEWLTADILTETLSHFTMAAEEGTAEWEAYKKSLMDDGYTAKQAEEILRLSNTATDAATKVKTFTQLWDTLKESAQSGWTQTWEIIVGDFEEAKGFLTEVSDKLGGMIGASAESRNTLLSEGLSSGWKQLLGAGIADEEGYKETFKSVAKEHGVSIDKMIEAEKKLDSSLTDSEAFQKALKKGFKDGSLSADMLSESVHKMAGKMSKMSAEELKAAGYTTEHVKQIKELSAGLKDGSISMDDFVKKMTRTSGRENLIQALWNAFDGLMSVIKPIKEAFRDVFEPLKGEQLYSFTEALVKFTEKLTLSSDEADKVKRIFKGLFSIFDIVKKAITSVVKALFGLSQSEGMGSFANLILDIAANIGDFFTQLNEGFDAAGLTGMLSSVSSGISELLSSLSGGLRGVGGLLSSFGSWIVKIVDKIWGVIKNVFGWIADNISAGDIFAGLAGGGIFKLATGAAGFFESLNSTLDKLFGNGSGMKGVKDHIVETLNAVSDALKAFTTGVKVWSILGIAVAIAVLTNALETLSTLRVDQIAKSLLTVGIMISMLMFSFKSMVKSLTSFGSKGILKSAAALILVAKAVDVLADVMVKLAGLSIAQIGKGLLAIAGALTELCIAVKIIDKTKISVSTGLAMLVLAHGCSVLGDALKKFGEMSWDEIGRGLSAMGGALTEVVAALAILSKAGGWKTLFGSVGILIAIQGLGELADALSKFGTMSWSEIGRGLSVMGGALTELGIVLGVLGKLSGFSSILAGGSILLVIQDLDELSDALSKFGEMSWPEIGRGLSAMGGALLEVAGFTGALGKIAGFSSLFGAGSMVLTIQGLSDLADALKKFAWLSWDEIGRGLTGMGVSLLEVAGMSGALGKIAGLSGLLGGGTILLAVQSLDDLANAFKKFGEMSWSEIGRGLVAMGGALIEVGGITGALGYLTNFAGLIGSASIWIAVQGLGDLADALKKFGEMSWSEIGRGLTAMGSALTELAVGGVLNTLSIIGSYSISKVAEPLGTLADSVKKWNDVKIPIGLGMQLSSLANAVASFTFSGFGASSIATVAAPLGTMADSVKKWTGVTVPEGIGKQLNALADGVFKFTLRGAGASALATAAAPLGVMADSVKKWSNVTVPENIGDTLKQLASGVGSFTFAFAGGWSISAIVGPLGSLPDAIKKWKDVTIPATLTNDLTGLADGIKAFSWAFMGGWSISAIIGPLGNLVDAVKKWANVKVPEGLKDSLKEIADGINEFGLLDIATLQLVDDNILSLSNAFKNFASVNVSGDTLVTFAKNIKSCSSELTGLNTSSITTAASTVDTLTSTLKNISSVNTDKVNKFVNAANALNKINISELKVDTSSLSSVINSIKGVMTSMSDTISSSKTSLSSAMKTAMSGAVNAIGSKKADITSAGKKLTDALAKSVSSKKDTITKSFKTLVSGAVGAVKDKYQSFYDAGSYLVSGFAAGISANSFKAEAKAKAMAEAAEKAAKEALDINSPSKVFRRIGMSVPEGFAQGIDRLQRLVRGSSEAMADASIDRVKDSLSRIVGIINGDVETQPTIRPVVDLSDVSSSAHAINKMLNLQPSVGLLSNVGSINTMMNRRLQNGSNDDVISAIKDLKGVLNNKSGDSYYIGDVAYGDDSAISEAVQLLVGAIIRERRT